MFFFYKETKEKNTHKKYTRKLFYTLRRLRTIHGLSFFSLSFFPVHNDTYLIFECIRKYSENSRFVWIPHLVYRKRTCCRTGALILLHTEQINCARNFDVFCILWFVGNLFFFFFFSLLLLLCLCSVCFVWIWFRWWWLLFYAQPIRVLHTHASTDQKKNKRTETKYMLSSLVLIAMNSGLRLPNHKFTYLLFFHRLL